MTELEHIEIEGFKGLEHVEFEPTDINLITGRNNTGKTSFLEAVNLLFNPSNLQQFSDNVDTVINVHYQESQIQGQTDESDPTVYLRKPEINEVKRYLSEAIPNSVSIQVPFSQSDLEEKPMRFEGLSGEIYSEIQQALNEIITEQHLSNAQNAFLVLSVHGDDYPYFSPGGVSDSFISQLQEEIDWESLMEDSDNVENTTKQQTLDGSPITPKLDLIREEKFLQVPNDGNTVEFIESTNLTDDIERTDDDHEPIKIDDIGDYIKETGLVDNLKTFTLDYLVFEDESGDKYQIPYNFMGDGFKSIVGLLWELMDDEVENDIVLLEEPETHMHPGYTREVVYFLIELAQEEDIQLFITTHDSDFINDFFTENLTDEEESYLEDEFSLLRMEEDSAVTEDYETARENLKDLHLDLRGI